MSDERASTPGPNTPKPGKPTDPRALIAWKGARLQIATEIFAAAYAGVAEGAGLPASATRERRWALEQAEQLLLDNEEMP